MIKSLPIAALVLFPVMAIAAPCSRSQAMSAERAVDHLKSWPEIYRWYKKFGGCDDGGISEGVSDAVETLLAKSWGDVPQVVGFGKSDSRFPAFVARHLGEITTFDNAVIISRTAKTSCPRGAATFCALLLENLGDMSRAAKP
jgi:hypothetical protein